MLVCTVGITWWNGASCWWKALGLSLSSGKISVRALYRTVGIRTFGFVAVFSATDSLFFSIVTLTVP